MQTIRERALPLILGRWRSMEVKRVPPDITVSVTHNKAPIAGVKVTVAPAFRTGLVLTGATDARGHLEIRGLAAGTYFLAASHLGFEAGKEWIEVVAAADRKTTDHLDFEWASDYQTRRIAGTLTGFAPGSTGDEWMDVVHPVRALYGGVAVSVRNAFGTAEYRTLSNRNGEFLIDHVPDGIYVLTIEGGEESFSGTAGVTTRLVDVRSSTPRDVLQLELCDTGYEHTEFELREN